MIPIFTPMIRGLRVYIRLTITDPCPVLAKRTGTMSHTKRRKQPKHKLRTLFELFRPHPERLSPNLPYTPYRGDESLTDHYSAAVDFDEFGSAHARRAVDTIRPTASLLH